MTKKRLDQALLELYPQWSRSKIQTLIEKGKVEVLFDHWTVVTKPSFKVASLRPEQVRLLEDQELQYVSRGALKLKKAVEAFQIDLEGRTTLDVGLSTGGFTDYLLKSGVKTVLGIDVGRDQLHPQLRNHPQLVFQDKVNAREGLPDELLLKFFGPGIPHLFDLIVVDVSFISLEKIIPGIAPYLKEAGDLITLLKPQFELSKKDLNKKGVVKSQEGLEFAQKKVVEVLQRNKLEIMGNIPSPIEGENGNKEFLIWSRWAESHTNAHLL